LSEVASRKRFHGDGLVCPQGMTGRNRIASPTNPYRPKVGLA
jgi:hypothetical protein